MPKLAPFRGVPVRRPVAMRAPSVDQTILDAIVNLRTLELDIKRKRNEFEDGINLIQTLLKKLEHVKRGPPGDPGSPGKNGKNVTPAEIEAAVRNLLVQPKDGIAPTADEVVARLLQSKKLLRLIKSMVPASAKNDTKLKNEELAAVVFAEMEKMGISLAHLKNIETRMAEVRNHVATSGMRGGGDTVVAGTGVTITNNVNGNKVISASGSGASLTREIPTGDVDGVNTTFIVTHTPVFLMMDGLMRTPGYGYTYATPTISVDPLTPPTQAIVSFYNA